MAYPNTTSQSLHTLKINKVPNEDTFAKMQEDNLVNANELYLVEDENNRPSSGILVTLTRQGGNWVADSTHSEIEDILLSGQNVFVRFNNYILSYSHFTSPATYRFSTTRVDDQGSTVTEISAAIDNTGTWTVYEGELTVPTDMEAFFLVNVTIDANDNITADYTYTEIDTAFNAGKIVLAKAGNHILHMTNQSEGNSTDHIPAAYSFSNFMADPWNSAIFENTLSIDDTNTWSSSFPYYTIPTKTSDLTNDSGFLTSFTETDPTVPSWAKASTKPSYTASEVGAAASSHTHGNITNSGDITASATIANGDRLVINDESASKITNSSITFGTNASQYLSNKGTWQNVPTVPTNISAFTNDSGYTTFSGSYNDLTNKPTIHTYTAGNGIDITNDTISAKNIMYITFTPTYDDSNDTYTVTNISKTFSDMYAHLQNNGELIAIDSRGVHEHFYVTTYDASMIWFSNIEISKSGHQLNFGKELCFYSNNTAYYAEVSTSFLDSLYLNGTSTLSPDFYAPTTSGTSGQVLKSNGNGQAPTWTTLTIPSAVTESTVSGWGFTKNTGTITGVSVNGTSVATSGVANITSMPASILSGTIPSGITATTQANSDNSKKIATTEFVKTAISGFSTTDEKVKLTSQSTSGTYPIIFGPTSITSNSTYQGYYDTGITINPSTDTITATNFAGNATTATSATKLTNASSNDISAGSAGTPVYFDNGIPKPVSLDNLREDMGISNPITFWGVTTEELSTGNTKTTLAGLTGTAQNGYVVIDSTGTQYIWGTVNSVAQWNAVGQGIAYKIIQSAVTSPTASGNTTAFIDTISQDANGVITATKRNLNTSGTWSGNATTATTASKLGSATLGSTTKPIYLNSGTATECSTYAGGTAVTLNNSSKAASTASFYAPTTGGTANYVLWANGTTSAPTWKEPKDALNYMINQLGTGSSTLTSNDYVITQYVGGGTTTTTYHRRPASAIRVGGLLTARKLKVALGSTTDATFDGTADQTSIPISGTLGISNGGTGATTAKVARENLGAAPTPFVAGTQTASTNVWTGALPSNVTEYYNGLTIDYFLPYAGTSSAATLNLGGLGAKPVYVGNAATTAVTTHFPANSVLHLTYIVNSALNSGNGCWKVTAYQNSTYYYESCYVTTGAGTAAKVGTLSNYALQPGYLQVAIYNANTAASALTLNINSTGAKPIYINGTASSSSNHTLPKGMYMVHYDGTKYDFRTDGFIDTYTNTIIGNSNSYGETLPASGTTGQIFFQTSDPYYELPAGGSVGQALIKNSASDRDVTWGSVGGVMTPNNSTKYYVSGSASTSENTNPAIFNTAIYVNNSVLFGAAWNDYAEYRQADSTEPGRCVIEKGDDTLTMSSKRMQPGAEIISDTFGFAIGQTEKAQTPIATSGRVLAYPYESLEEFKNAIGRPVCSGPNGTVSIMTDEEYQKFGYCAIGTISAVPEYETWGENNVIVNNRVWIRVR